MTRPLYDPTAVSRRLEAAQAEALAAQLDGMAKSPAHIDKFAVTRAFIVQVRDLVVDLKSQPQARTPCPNCGERPAFEINTARCETPAYAAVRNASIDRMIERGMG
jgi:hypothetical protein